MEKMVIDVIGQQLIHGHKFTTEITLGRIQTQEPSRIPISNVMLKDVTIINRAIQSYTSANIFIMELTTLVKH